MDINEKSGNKVSFNFLVNKSHQIFDCHYTLEDAVIKDLINDIAQRGHEIGLHGSYNTYLDKGVLNLEAGRLSQFLERNHIDQSNLGNRQHYLRWETPTTATIINAAGLDYDSTLAYADHSGFRCGTCHEFPMFDLNSRQELRLRQKPLIIMECSVIEKRYMGLGCNINSLRYMQMLKNRCKQFNGNFTLLWHNSNLTTKKERKLYAELIQ